VRNLVYRTTGPLLGAAIVFRLIFCPADLCAHTMAGQAEAETPSAAQHSESSRIDTGRATTTASVVSTDSRSGQNHGQPCHGEKSQDQTDAPASGASCCNDETVTDAPFSPALSINEVLLDRLAAAVRQPLELATYRTEIVDFQSGPPDGLRLHLKNQTFLN